MVGHARLSASKAAIWTRCAAAPRLWATAPPDPTIYAAEGTVAHQIAERIMRDPRMQRADTHPWAGTVSYHADGFEVPVTREMLDAVWTYVDHCRALWRASSAYGIEAHLDMREIDPDFGGIADFWAIVGDTLHVVDLKTGAGQPVAADTLQARYYGLGVLVSQRANVRHVTTARTTIIQPRCDFAGPPIRSSDHAPIDLLDLAFELGAAADATRQPDAPFTPGEHCLFCPSRVECPALAGRASAVLAENVNALDADTLGERLHLATALASWIKAVRARGLAEARSGTPPTGWKLVAGRSTRTWAVDAAAVVKAVQAIDPLIAESELYHRELLSPAEAEKLVPRDRRGELAAAWRKGTSAPTLAPATDVRPEMAPPASDDFAGLVAME